MKKKEYAFSSRRLSYTFRTPLRDILIIGKNGIS